ncbi:hypothetical protein [Paenibacillus wynnii]|uniref:hypothetical protein n=1 Tax=Paenibacillus wynnii TaxID=268407 RepID=UPI002790CAFD|nr:hypothetical protein [Paenibacillus wynnii]MDQ0193152.1 hypothetical protein [Paenibacillus wynnii]
MKKVSYDEYAEKYRPDLKFAGTESARNYLVIEIAGELKGTVGRYWVSEETNWFEIGI